MIDILPVVIAAIECPTHSIVDAALRTLPVVLPTLDFSTIKNELFPVVAQVFSKTTSLAIKVRGLQSFVILCGGSPDAAGDDGLSGLSQEKKTSASALDKYTMQEKIIPLIKVIKTKEPAVMIAALNVIRIVGQIADADFVAMEILPILWTMSLGPLLDLKQFQQFMDLVKSLSRRVEDEQTKKLQELSGTSNPGTAAPAEDFLAFGGVTGTTFDSGSGGATADDFEALVKGRAGGGGDVSNGQSSWDDPAPATTPSMSQPSPATPQAATFSWSTKSTPSMTPTSQASAGFRTVTPDLNRFEPMAPSSTQFSQPLQPSTSNGFSPPAAHQATQSSSSINWSTTANTSPPNPWAQSTPNYSSSSMSMNSSMASMSMGQQRPSLGGQTSSSRGSSFSLPPPPGAGSSQPNYSGMSGFGIQPPPAQSSASAWASNSNTSNSMGMRNVSNSMNTGMAMNKQNTLSMASQQQQQQQKPAGSGLDKYQSLI